MKKKFGVIAFIVMLVFVSPVFSYDTKIIDEATNLNNIHHTVRPIGHYGSGAVGRSTGLGTANGPRAIGVGYTVEDTVDNAVFFDGNSRIGVSNTSNTGYVTAKVAQLTVGGGKGVAMHQAESASVWRSFPMSPGQISGPSVGVVSMSNPSAFIEMPFSYCVYGWPMWFFGQLSCPVTPADYMMNVWAVSSLVTVVSKTGFTPLSLAARLGSNYSFWGGSPDRIPSVHPTQPRTPRYGYAVPRIEARGVANALFVNPGTNNVNGEQGQETMTSVFVWSADKDSTSPEDAAGVSATSANMVAVMARLDNDLYKGLKVSDLNVIKVKGTAGHQLFTRVDSASSLRGGTFAVVHRSGEAVRDVVVNGDHILQAGSREGNDPEWQTMQYFVLFCVEKGTVFDVASASQVSTVADPAIIVAERPFVKTPNPSLPLPSDVAPRFGWVRGNRNNAESRYDGFTRDPFVADNIFAPARAERDRYPATALAAMTNWNQMFFVSDAVVDRYGFAAERGTGNVYKLPAVRAADVPTGKTALVMFTIRVGDGEMELPAPNFVGKTPADIRVIDVRSDIAPAEITEFTPAYSIADLTDGSFAIMKPNAFQRHEQDVMGANEAFVEGGIYFVALAVRDNGEYDLDTSKPLSNNESWVSPAFLVLGGGVTPTPEPAPTPEPNPTPTPAPVSGGSSGGCSVGEFGSATLLLLIPLFLLLKK